ncbi:MAG: hypothetical protein L6420_10465 [Elusimicrobia bacterium]|nr:hypothetical protein [Elusimicrobiota bacterium]
MRKLSLIFCLCFVFFSPVFAQSEIPKSQGSNKKLFALKASGKSWYNDISAPDCRVLAFSYADKIIRSENIILKSRERWQQCAKGKTGIACQTLNSGPLHKKNAGIEIHPAVGMYPWEYNRFKICLKGANLSIEQVKTAYNYDISKSLSGDSALFIAKPVQKIKMAPDINGLSIKSIEQKEEAIIFKLFDKWCEYYSGKTEIKMSLFKKRFFKDKLIGKYSSDDFSDDVYEIILSKDITGALKSGKYYLKWSFRRIGDNVSDSVLIEKGKTPVFKIEKAQ